MTPATSQPRWSVPMRLLHWSAAIAFFGLLASGLALENPELRGIPLLGSRLVREVHLTWAVLLPIGPALAAAWDGFREPARVWASDRFNPGQRLNVVLVVLLLAGLMLTGTLLSTDRLAPPAWRELAYSAHKLLALATLPVVSVHIVLGLSRFYTGDKR